MSFPKNLSKRMLPICLMAALLLLISSLAMAGKLKEYSADQYLIQKGKEQKTGKIFVSKEKFRMEHTIPGQPEEMLMIIRQDKQLSWTIFPGKKKYIESRLTEEDMKNTASFLGPGNMKIKTQDESLGSETIQGYKCEKKRIVSTVEMMGREITSSSTVWMTEELGFPIRTENEDGTVSELRNIEDGAQDKSLFELPSGYARAADIMEVMRDGLKEEEGSEEGMQTGGENPIPEDVKNQMPEDIRKMIEDKMGKQ